MIFLEAKGINWSALKQLGRTGHKVEDIVKQVWGHAEGQNVFSKVVIESRGSMPEWVATLLEQEGILVEVFTP